jgi:hypothetical protein
MPATFDDVREALVAAVLHFEANNSAVMPPLQYFDSYDLNLHPNGVPIIFQRVQIQGGYRWDYGHPTMYLMDSGNILQLQTLANELGLTLLARAWKPALNCYEVNLVKDVGTRRFNYHVAVT